MNLINPDPYQNCRLCPRQCKVNRLEAGVTGKLGFCGESAQLRIGYVGPHFGEEPPISGSNGSGNLVSEGLFAEVQLLKVSSRDSSLVKSLLASVYVTR